jgi:hypothetical protein
VQYVVSLSNDRSARLYARKAPRGKKAKAAKEAAAAAAAAASQAAGTSTAEGAPAAVPPGGQGQADAAPVPKPPAPAPLMIMQDHSTLKFFPSQHSKDAPADAKVRYMLAWAVP